MHFRATGNRLTGIETSLDVEFEVEVRKKADVTSPRVENSDHLITIGSQPEFASSLDNALKMATTDMVRWLVKDYQLEPWAAHLLIGYQARYDVVTVMGSMALKIPKKYLPQPSGSLKAEQEEPWSGCSPISSGSR